VGLEDSLTQEEKNWYILMKDFPGLITLETTEEDYPVTPNRLL
jgi:hypothetical protein